LCVALVGAPTSDLEISVIAIVDDDGFVRESTKVLVETLGYEALTFFSAEDFLQSDDLQTASFLITDVQMPGQSGLDLLEHLTRRGFSIPAIVVSAFLNDKNRARALKAGALGCLAKPYREESLIKYLEMALGRRPPTARYAL
jgi:FixJ family two-component response regulator